MMRINYIMQRSALGLLCVATTKNGVCRVFVADNETQILKQLHKDFPKTYFTELTSSESLQAILAYLEGQQTRFDMSLDIQVSAFQQQVFDLLQAIPYGETRSYQDIAEAIGNPKTIRAVAQACKANPVPLIIPCHRVIASDGSLGGFALGLARKQALLDLEHRTKF